MGETLLQFKGTKEEHEETCNFALVLLVVETSVMHSAMLLCRLLLRLLVVSLEVCRAICPTNLFRFECSR